LQALSALLRVLGGRLTCSDVMDLLDLGCIGINRHRADEIERINRWVVESGVRWGVDAAAPQRSRQPAFDEFSWRFGLDRLLLGYAMPGNGSSFCRPAACDDVEGSETASLGKLADFCETLFELRPALSQPPGDRALVRAGAGAHAAHALR